MTDQAHSHPESLLGLLGSDPENLSLIDAAAHAAFKAGDTHVATSLIGR